MIKQCVNIFSKVNRLILPKKLLLSSLPIDHSLVSNKLRNDYRAYFSSSKKRGDISPQSFANILKKNGEQKKGQTFYYYQLSPSHQWIKQQFVCSEIIHYNKVCKYECLSQMVKSSIQNGIKENTAYSVRVNYFIPEGFLAFWLIKNNLLNFSFIFKNKVPNSQLARLISLRQLKKCKLNLRGDHKLEVAKSILLLYQKQMQTQMKQKIQQDIQNEKSILKKYLAGYTICIGDASTFFKYLPKNNQINLKRKNKERKEKKLKAKLFKPKNKN